MSKYFFKEGISYEAPFDFSPIKKFLEVIRDKNCLPIFPYVSIRITDMK